MTGSEMRDRFPFETQLLADAEFRSLVQDDHAAQQAFLMFVNRAWIKDDERFVISWGRAGGLVADARGKGEDYTVFKIGYCWEGWASEPGWDARYRELFLRHGWHEIQTEPAPLQEAAG